MAKKSSSRQKKNKLGVKNSLVNNINAKKKKGTSRSKKRSTVSAESYAEMQEHWGKEKGVGREKKAVKSAKSTSSKKKNAARKRSGTKKAAQKR